MVTAETTAPASRETLFAWLDEVMDPEVPVISVVDLGIVRDIAWQQPEGGESASPGLVVTVTPTYSGCPATEVIAQSIREALQARGIHNVSVRQQLSPAWTTDWMSPKGRDALRLYGIAAPVTRVDGSQIIDVSALASRPCDVPCPQCGSGKTRLLSQFGSTACKALYVCTSCSEPFDYFKPH